jgi:hypothetical protein
LLRSQATEDGEEKILRIDRSRPSTLFHGAPSPAEGPALIASGPWRDFKDPKVKCVFATPFPAYAALFAHKRLGVNDIGMGEQAFLLGESGSWGGAFQPTIYQLSSEDFCSIDEARWVAMGDVSLEAAPIIVAPQARGLVARGVIFLTWGDKAPLARDDVVRQLIYQRTRRETVAAVTALVASGDLKVEFDSLAPAHSQARLIPCFERARSSPDQWARLIDENLLSLLPFRSAVRIIHGLDHVIRTAVIARVLWGALPRQSKFSVSEDMQDGLLLAALLHDAGRISDHGPDHSEFETAALARSESNAVGGEKAAAQVVAWLEEKARWPEQPTSLPAALLQAADAMELVRNYRGLIDLSRTAIASLLRPRDETLLAHLDGVLVAYLAWLRENERLGLEGDLVSFSGHRLVTGARANVRSEAIVAQCLAPTPATDCVQTLKRHPILWRAFQSSFAGPQTRG